jgi:hypothetical protein
MRSLAALLALSPFFWKGVAVTICAFILFVGSIYLLLAAVFGLRMGYLVLAVSFFGWMIIMAALWTFGAAGMGTLPNLGPRGVEAHWQVFAAGTGPVDSTRFPDTGRYPGAPWRLPNASTTTSVDTVKAVMQKYLAGMATTQLEDKGTKVCSPDEVPPPGCFVLDPTTFSVQDMEFTRVNGKTDLAAAHGYYQLGGPQVTVYAYFDKGDVPKYSIGFLVASILGFVIHLPFLDRAERRRKEILTGGTAPAWYGPA